MANSKTNHEKINKGGKNMVDGFHSYEAGAKLYKVTHDKGTTLVYATNETLALQRFIAKYPERTVYSVKKN